jgi:hypothetical protein
MLEKTFILKSLNGKFKRMNFYVGMTIDLQTLLALLD